MANKKIKKRSRAMSLIVKWLRYIFFQERIFSEERKKFLIERETYIKKREAEIKKAGKKR